MKHKPLLIAIILITLVSFSSCSNRNGAPATETPLSYFANQDSGVQDGGVQMIAVNTPKGKFKVWTKRIGNNPTTKVLILHGGPGGTHDAYESFESFLPKEGIEFIYYDQLASGNSDNPKDTSLFDLSRYVEEVEQVRTALNLDKSNFILYGHSWGGILAMQYALKYQDNLKGLIISNMMASCPEYGKYANEVLAKQMPPAVLDSIRMIEARGDFQNPKYMELLVPNFYEKHVIRMSEWPEPVSRMFAKLNSDIYVIMQGPSEFGISGKLVDWDVSKELKNIKVPALVIAGTHDTMDPKYLEWMSKEMPNGQYLLCPNGSHMSMYDDQQTYFAGLTKFVKGIK